MSVCFEDPVQIDDVSVRTGFKILDVERFNPRSCAEHIHDEICVDTRATSDDCAGINIECVIAVAACNVIDRLLHHPIGCPAAAANLKIVVSGSAHGFCCLAVAGLCQKEPVMTVTAEQSIIPTVSRVECVITQAAIHEIIAAAGTDFIITPGSGYRCVAMAGEQYVIVFCAGDGLCGDVRNHWGSPPLHSRMHG